MADAITDEYLARQFSKFGSVVACHINRARGHALVTFETVSLEFCEFSWVLLKGVLRRNFGGSGRVVIVLRVV